MPTIRTLLQYQRSCCEFRSCGATAEPQVLHFSVILLYADVFCNHSAAIYNQ